MILYSFLQETAISELVKDPEWQELRSSLVGTWKKQPDANCRLLRNYLGDIHNCQYYKLKIVMNYLTGSGFRMGTIKHPCIQKLRNDIGQELKERRYERDY